MSDIVLSDQFVDFDLYVVPAQPKKAHDDSKIKSLPIKILSGGNQKRTLIVYSFEVGKDYLPETEMTLLRKIFDAIKYDLEKDTAHVGITSGNSISFAQLGENLEFNYVVSFGIPLNDLGIDGNFDHYAPVLKSGMTVVQGHDLKDLSVDKSKKISLWKCLQATFLK